MEVFPGALVLKSHSELQTICHFKLNITKKDSITKIKEFADKKFEAKSEI